jgi:hypothetical protein
MDRQLVEAAKNYRLTVLEKKAEYHDRELTELRQLIGRLSSDALMKSAINKPELALPIMEVPKEISYRPQNGKKVRNRQAHVVAQRWECWRKQYEAGMTVSMIAKAWDCHHATVIMAKKCGWLPSIGKKRRGILVKSC